MIDVRGLCGTYVTISDGEASRVYAYVLDKLTKSDKEKVRKWNVNVKYNWDDYEDKHYIYSNDQDLIISKEFTIRNEYFSCVGYGECGKIERKIDLVFECNHDTIVGLEMEVTVTPIVE